MIFPVNRLCRNHENAALVILNEAERSEESLVC
jgi:hypothetical protein